MLPEAQADPGSMKAWKKMVNKSLRRIDLEEEMPAPKKWISNCGSPTYGKSYHVKPDPRRMRK